MRRLVYLLAAFAIAASGTAAQVRAGGSAAQHFGCPGKDIKFKASDGTRLDAIRYGKGRTFVVLAHQGEGSLCQWADYAPRLASLGYSALAFDFRGNGESQTRAGAAASRWDIDVAAAVKLARTLGARKVFVAGASTGGYAALIAAPTIRPPLAGLISLSTEPQLGPTDATVVVRKLTIPVLYLASKNDLAKETQALYDATASTDKAIKLLPGNAHGVDLLSPILGRPAWRTAQTLFETFLRTH